MYLFYLLSAKFFSFVESLFLPNRSDWCVIPDIPVYVSRKLFLQLRIHLSYLLISFLFLRTYACVVYSSLQERQQSCLEVLPPNTMREGRRVNTMSMPVKEAQETHLLKASPRG
jgi:hypothetical protein